MPGKPQPAGPRPLHDPIAPPERDPPTKPLHDPPGDPTYEPPRPITEPTPNPANDPPPERPTGENLQQLKENATSLFGLLSPSPKFPLSTLRRRNDVLCIALD
jgi:hypothetical protein